MPDGIFATDLTTETSFAQGARVLVRNQPLLGPTVVDRVCPRWVGDPEENTFVECADGVRRQWRDLVACPDGYEPLPSRAELRRTLSWVRRHWKLLVSLHGDITMIKTVRHLRKRIQLNLCIAAALAEEPGASAMHQAELAMGKVPRR